MSKPASAKSVSSKSASPQPVSPKPVSSKPASPEPDEEPAKVESTPPTTAEEPVKQAADAKQAEATDSKKTKKGKNALKKVLQAKPEEMALTEEQRQHVESQEGHLNEKEMTLKEGEPPNIDDFLSPLGEREIDALKKAFSKYDKKMGSVRPDEVANVFRMAGQNPTMEEANKMINEAEESDTGMIMFNDLVQIVEKYWKNYENYEQELREACNAFDKDELGVMDFEELKNILTQYGEKLDDDDIEIFEQALKVNDGKIIVDEFITMLSPLETNTKGKGKKEGKEKRGKGKKTAN